MTAEQSKRIDVAFAREVARSATTRLCIVCADVLSVTSAGITIMGGDHAGPVCIPDAAVSALEDLEYMVGQGPCRDAFLSATAVHVPRLDSSTAFRWPSFVELARASGIGAVFAYPLIVDRVNVGVLTLYQRHEGDLSNAQHEAAGALAEVLAETVLSLQRDAPPGRLAPALKMVVAYREEIYQAAGMVAIQLTVSAADALARIRAFAFANDQAVAATAARIVSGRLVLDNDRLLESEV